MHFENEFQALKEKLPTLRWINRGEQRFKDYIKSKYSIRGNQLIHRTGNRPAQMKIDEMLLYELKQGDFLSNKNFDNSDYIEFKVERPINEHAVEVKAHLEKAIRNNHIFFVDANIENQFKEVVSKHFLPERLADGTVYRKINSNGVPGFNAYSFDELISSLELQRFIDKDKTEISQAAHKGKLISEALSILGQSSLTDDNRNSVERLVGQMRALEGRSIQIKKTVPKISKDFLLNEFKTQSMAELGLTAEGMNLADHNAVNSRAKSKLEDLDDLSNIKASFTSETTKDETWYSLETN